MSLTPRGFCSGVCCSLVGATHTSHMMCPRFPRSPSTPNTHCFYLTVLLYATPRFCAASASCAFLGLDLLVGYSDEDVAGSLDANARGVLGAAQAIAVCYSYKVVLCADCVVFVVRVFANMKAGNTGAQTTLSTKMWASP